MAGGPGAIFPGPFCKEDRDVQEATRREAQRTIGSEGRDADTSSSTWAPKHSKQADFTRLSGLFIGTVEYQVEGSFVVLMWALLLRCATSQVTGILG